MLEDLIFGLGFSMDMVRTNQIKPSRELYVGNLPPGTTKQTLGEFFSKRSSGKAERIFIKGKTGKKFAFVLFDSIDTSMAILTDYNLNRTKYTIQGFQLRINRAKKPPKSDNPLRFPCTSIAAGYWENKNSFIRLATLPHSNNHCRINPKGRSITWGFCTEATGNQVEYTIQLEEVSGKICLNQPSSSLYLHVKSAPRIYTIIPQLFDDPKKVRRSGDDQPWIGQSNVYQFIIPSSEFRSVIERCLLIPNLPFEITQSITCTTTSLPDILPKNLPESTHYLCVALANAGLLRPHCFWEDKNNKKTPSIFATTIETSSEVLSERVLSNMYYSYVTGSNCIARPLLAFEHFKSRVVMQEKMDKKNNANYNNANNNLMPSYCDAIRIVLVTPTTILPLPAIPILSNRVVRQYQPFAKHFLRVSFTEEDLGLLHLNPWDPLATSALSERVTHIITHGLDIANAHYSFLAFSSSQLRESSAWFFKDPSPTDDISSAAVDCFAIRKWMGDFSKERVIGKYAARMGQCFSSTTPALFLSKSQVAILPDITRGKYCCSDGVGRIDPSLASTVARKLKLATIPSAFQIRMAGFKGVLFVHPTASPTKTPIEMRSSMQKFSSTHYELEICSWSKNIPGFLNRQLVQILSMAHGIADDVFLEMQRDVLTPLNAMLQDKDAALLFLSAEPSKSNRRLVKMLRGGIPITEPFVQRMLKVHQWTSLYAIKHKARVAVPQSRLGMGVLDETNTLHYNEIFFQHSDVDPKKPATVVVGTVVVARNPALHPGDVRLMQAVNCPALKGVVDCVVFSQRNDVDAARRGKEAMPPQMCLSGGDLDGDLYWVCWDSRLVWHGANAKPMQFDTQGVRKKETAHGVTIDEVKRFFVNFMENNCLGQIAMAHLAWADQCGITSSECLQLAQLHSVAVDFPKTGVKAEMPRDLHPKIVPNFIRGLHSKKAGYKSEKVLAKMYRDVHVPTADRRGTERITADQKFHVAGWKEYEEEARELKDQYDHQLATLMDQYGIETEEELLLGKYRTTKAVKGKSRVKALSKGVQVVVDYVLANYKRQFLDYAEDERPKVASAWYHVSNKNVRKPDEGERVMLSFPWLAYETLIKVHKQNS